MTTASNSKCKQKYKQKKIHYHPYKPLKPFRCTDSVGYVWNSKCVFVHNGELKIKNNATIEEKRKLIPKLMQSVSTNENNRYKKKCPKLWNESNRPIDWPIEKFIGPSSRNPSLREDDLNKICDYLLDKFKSLFKENVSNKNCKSSSQPYETINEFKPLPSRSNNLTLNDQINLLNKKNILTNRDNNFLPQIFNCLKNKFHDLSLSDSNEIKSKIRKRLHESDESGKSMFEGNDYDMIHKLLGERKDCCNPKFKVETDPNKIPTSVINYIESDSEFINIACSETTNAEKHDKVTFEN